MQIAIVSGIYPPDIGGPATYVPRIADALAAANHTVSVVALSDRLEYDDSLYRFSVQRILRPQPKWRRMPQTIRAIAATAHDADIIFAHGLFIESTLATRLVRKPLIIKIVGDWAWERSVGRGRVHARIEDFQNTRYDPRTEALKLLRSRLARQADTVITPSQYLRRIVVGWGVCPERTHVIYNALEPTSDIPAIRLPGFNGHTIVTVGRLVPWKGIDRLLRIVATMPDIRLIVVGDGPERAKLESIATDLRMNGQALFVGQVPAKQVGAYLQTGDAFVLNSTYEGLPHIVLEAMQVGVPVIATDVGGTPEVVQHNHNGLLVPPQDDDALRTALEELVANISLRQCLTKNASSTVTEKFSWHRLVNETVTLLEDTAQRTK